MVLIFAEQQTDAGFNTHAKVPQQMQQQMPAYATQQMTAAPGMYSGYNNNMNNTSYLNDQKAKYLLAERYKTKMCRNYMTTGACPYTHRCMFAHGQQELRTTDMNVRDGLMTEEAIRSFQRAMTAYNRGEMSAEYPAQHQPQQQAQQHNNAEQCPCDDCAAASARAAGQHNPYYAAMPQAFASAGYGQQE